MAFLSKNMRQLLQDLDSETEAAQALQSKKGVTAEELNKKTSEIQTIKAKIESQKAIDGGKEFDAAGTQVVKAKEEKPISKFASLEYRKAFMDYAKTGKSSNILEFRSADASTTTGDVGAIIPSTILEEVIKKVETYGQIFSRVRKLAVRGGLKVPILSLKPTATWIGESAPSSRQKIQMTDSVSFTYYGLECKVATSILADTVTLAQFESILIDVIGEAVTKAMDIVIVKGDGTTGPLGITKDTRIPSKQIITLKPDEFTDWSTWKKKVFAKMPLSYKGGAEFFMASGTYEGYIDGMVDKQGQPVGRVNYSIAEGPQERFGGKPVVEVEDDVIANYDDAATGDVVAIYGNLNNYAINSNMQLTMFRYLDHDTNQWVDKALLIADGKILDPNGFVIVKKGEATTGT